MSLAIPQGALAVVHGPTASGKTSLLLAIRGEMRLTSGRAIVRGRVAYVAADPWLFGGSVRDNIVCRRPWDQQRYMAALEACALDRGELVSPTATI